MVAGEPGRFKSAATAGACFQESRPVCQPKWQRRSLRSTPPRLVSVPPALHSEHIVQFALQPAGKTGRYYRMYGSVRQGCARAKHGPQEASMSFSISGVGGCSAPQITSGASAYASPTAKMSSLFQQIDSGNSGSITQAQFQQAFAAPNPPASFQTQGAVRHLQPARSQRNGLGVEARFRQRHDRHDARVPAAEVRAARRRLRPHPAAATPRRNRSATACSHSCNWAARARPHRTTMAWAESWTPGLNCGRAGDFESVRRVEAGP